MIFPLLRGFCPWRSSPVTWAIFFLNAAMLLITTALGAGAERDFDRALDDGFLVATQGRLYAYHLGEGAGRALASPMLASLGVRALEDGPESASARDALGQFAFRDEDFLNGVTEPAPGVDPVAFAYWRESNLTLRQLREVHPSFNLGLSAGHQEPANWVTYMFVHGGFLHFAGNMLFLLIFGGALELQIGGLALCVTYLSFGVCAAGIFALASGVSASPLVGASGAVSGIVAFYVALNWRVPCRYFFWWLLPSPEYMGFREFPAWVALALALAADLAGFLSTPPELGGVANAAHLGGTLAGLLAGGTVLLVRRGRGGRGRAAALAIARTPI